VDAFDLLVRDGTALTERPGRGIDHQVAGRVDRKTSPALYRQADLARVGARSHQEVVFQCALRSVVEQVDAGIDGGIADAAKGGDVVQPAGAVAHQVAAGAGQRLFRSGVGNPGADWLGGHAGASPQKLGGSAVEI